MVMEKKFNFIIYKPEDYHPVDKRERKRITRIVMKRIFELANRFDGTLRITIRITAKGNA